MKKKYVLITPAKNEELFISKTMNSLLSQTILPIKWIIVSDGSTDGTDDIVKKYSKDHKFIDFVRLDSSKERNFRSKVNAFKAGYKRINKIEYDYIGNLDADVSFGPNYYECVLSILENNPNIGIAGGGTVEIIDDKYYKEIDSPWNIPGAIQLFRKKCFEDIGGYISAERGIDAIAVIMARMKGWEIKKRSELKVYHHRKSGTGKDNILVSRFKYGASDFTFGFHPIYMIFKFINRIRQKPIILSSISRLCGYFYAYLRQRPFVLPKDVIEQIRNEQKNRIIEIISKFLVG